MSLRRMRNLFFRLPARCETWFEVGDIPEDVRGFDNQMHMLANIVDVLQRIDWHIVAANSKRPPKPPKPFPRPSVKKKQKKKQWLGKTIVDRGQSNGAS